MKDSKILSEYKKYASRNFPIKRNPNDDEQIERIYNYLQNNALNLERRVSFLQRVKDISLFFVGSFCLALIG